MPSIGERPQAIFEAAFTQLCRSPKSQLPKR
jgi:hypothetical protein